MCRTVWGKKIHSVRKKNEEEERKKTDGSEIKKCRLYLLALWMEGITAVQEHAARLFFQFTCMAVKKLA